MTVAEHLHFAGDLNDLMKTMPHRQFLMWQERIKRGWNQPDRHDHYLMQIAQEVRVIFSKERDMRIVFKERPVQAEGDWAQPTPEQAALSEGSWMTAMGVTKEGGT